MEETDPEDLKKVYKCEKDSGARAKMAAVNSRNRSTRKALFSNKVHKKRA